MTISPLGIERRRGLEPDAQRYFDSRENVQVVKLFSGDYYVTRQDERLVTILGSCVAACIRDPLAGIGGMNHFLLPGECADLNNASARYGAYAMEQLINEILKAGGVRERLEVKAFGGGNVINQATLIGSRNADFLRRFLAEEGLALHAEDLGGPYPRRLHYYPLSGRVMLRHLRRREDREVLTEESSFARTLTTAPPEGDIELF